MLRTCQHMMKCRHLSGSNESSQDVQRTTGTCELAHLISHRVYLIFMKQHFGNSSLDHGLQYSSAYNSHYSHKTHNTSFHTEKSIKHSEQKTFTFKLIPKSSQRSVCIHVRIISTNPVKQDTMFHLKLLFF